LIGVPCVASFVSVTTGGVDQSATVIDGCYFEH